MAVTNAKILQLLAPHLSKEFNDRIPSITASNMEQVGETISSYPTLANEFCQVLTNQVIRTMFKTRTLDNPLSMFEKGDLSKFGKSLEMIYVDVIQGKDFTDRFNGSYEAEVLAPVSYDNVKVQYLTENSRLKYKVTISTDMLASAFKNENGLSTMANQLVSKMVESYNVDKFLLTWKLIDKMKTNKLATVKPVDKNSAKAFSRKVKEVIKNMRFPSREFNASGVMTKSSSSDLFIIMDTYTSALLDVELLADTFNMSKVELKSRIVEVPYFADPNRIALIVDRDKLQIFSTKYASDTVKNGAGLFTNVFLHRWDLFGACDFANCVELVADLDTATQIPIYSSATYEYDGDKTTAKISDGAVKPSTELQTRSMPYDIITLEERDADGTVIADMTETEIEIDSNGEIKSKVEKKVKETKKKKSE